MNTKTYFRRPLTQVKFSKDESGEVIGCKVTNGRVRNLNFEKLKP